jgi:membrane protease YdiL (CAAX protease family)
MPEAPNGPAPQSPAAKPQPRGRAALLARHRWITFLLPLLVFMLLGTLEPTPDTAGGKMIGLAIPYTCYPAVYTLKILLTTAAVVFVLPGYRQFPLRISPLAVLVGMVGVVVWVGLCSLHLERDYLQPFLEGHVQPLLKPVGLDWIIPTGTRSAFNPLEQLQAHPLWAWGFLAIRFAGLAIVVPLVEELFLRGFLMRFVVDPKWWEVPMGKATTWAVMLATAVPMLMHPAELLAAAAWFSMITWMYLKTRNVWDCVAAHAVTNLLLGIYVVAWDQWQLM